MLTVSQLSAIEKQRFKVEIHCYLELLLRPPPCTLRAWRRRRGDLVLRCKKIFFVTVLVAQDTSSSIYDVFTYMRILICVWKLTCILDLRRVAPPPASITATGWHTIIMIIFIQIEIVVKIIILSILWVAILLFSLMPLCDDIPLVCMPFVAFWTTFNLLETLS